MGGIQLWEVPSHEREAAICGRYPVIGSVQLWLCEVSSNARCPII